MGKDLDIVTISVRSSAGIGLALALSLIPTSVWAVCGDGTVEPFTETCDDGNTNDGDCCSSSCTQSTCSPFELCEAAVEAALARGHSDLSAWGSATFSFDMYAFRSRPAGISSNAKLKFTWRRNSTWADSEIGDPTASTRFTICTGRYEPPVDEGSIILDGFDVSRFEFTHTETLGSVGDWRHRDTRITYRHRSANGASQLTIGLNGARRRNVLRLKIAGDTIPFPAPESDSVYVGEDGAPIYLVFGVVNDAGLVAIKFLPFNSGFTNPRYLKNTGAILRYKPRLHVG